MGEESPVGGDIDRCPPPHRDGQRACRDLGGDVLYRKVHAWALTQ
jgi:hypothetical protein